MTGPDDPLAAALLGTRRLGTQGAEAELLAQAGTAALCEAAGVVPRQTRPVAPQSSPDQRPPASATRCLGALLDGQYSDLLGEFLTRLAAQGYVAPAEYLPALLERGGRVYALRPAVLGVIGGAGRALAAQVPNWRYATPQAQDWEGVLAEWRQQAQTTRQGILYQTRIFDPPLGRRLLEATWKSETLAVTVWAVGMLAVNLSSADEPFLESALDDRNAAVRRKAAELLAKLPGSRLGLRLAAASADIVDWTSQEAVLEVTFPDPLPPALVRDGVQVRTWRDAAKARAAQLTDLVAGVPLSAWTDRWSLMPAALVAGALKSRQAAALLKGFALAAERQRDGIWAEALLRADPALLGQGLVGLLSDVAFAALLEEIDDIAPLGKTSPYLRLLGRRTVVWSPELVRDWLSRLSMHLAHYPPAADLTLRGAVKAAARLCPPPMSAEVATCLADLTSQFPAWTADLADAAHYARFRAKLFATLEEDT